MSNTGHKWIYRKTMSRLKEPIRYKVRVYHKGKSIDVGFYRTLEEALKRRSQYIEDNGISEKRLKRYNTRNENKD